jgi:uncharacterized protein
MNTRVRILSVGILTMVLATAWVSCCDDNNSSNPAFDRSALLQNVADNIIIPAYADLEAEVKSLQSEATAFTQNPTLTSLAAAQLAWEKTYLSWQYANAFNFGPGGEEGLRKGLIEEIGTFPVSETKINSILSSGAYNLNDFNRDARGFLAVEYLLFSLTENDQAIVDGFSSTTRKKYLNDLIANIKSRLNDVATAWNGSYKATFISNNGTDVGSSTSQFYNEFVRSFETIKNFKIELPLGKRPGQTKIEPQLVEAYYSGKSVKLLKAHLIAIENIWYGRKKDGTDGVGFEEYLKRVTGGPELMASTKAQLEQIKTKMNAIPEIPRLSTQVKTAPMPVDNLRIELQKHTRYFKSDMSSLLGLAITFSSGDGD